MPAIITHHLFGEDASSLLPDGALVDQEELLAFLLGSQGPDPLWARFSGMPSEVRACHDAAWLMHRHAVVETLCTLYQGALQFPAADAAIGTAYALGFAAHYLLDSMIHPLIIAQVSELVTVSPELAGAEQEVHALIESDVDTWMLWQKRHKTILETPAHVALASTPRVNRVLGALLAQVTRQVHGIVLQDSSYPHALRDYRTIYRLIDPPALRLPRSLQRLERLGRTHSRIEAQRHRVIASDECASANLNHHRWRNPYTGEVSCASIADLFHDALLAWPTFARRLADLDRVRLEAMADGHDYMGKPH